MSLLESIFYMAWRGIAIGVLISAPMGPVGILCIQRTLEKGRKAGFYTGIGAALSDFFYCLLTAFGLSFIEDFIERNQDVIQLFGSVVLIAFSIYLFRKSPSSSLRRPVPQGISPGKNILGGFLFTFSNPLILFLTIGLFARFNFLTPEMHFFHYLIGFIFLMGGALGWWYGVTFVIDKIRKRFSYRTMKKINIGIGVVILAFAIVGIITGIMGLTTPKASAAPTPPAVMESNVRHWNEHRGYHPFADTTGVKAITLTNDKTAPAVFSVYMGDYSGNSLIDFRFTAANKAAHPMKRYPAYTEDGKRQTSSLPPWGLILSTTGNERLVLMLPLSENTDDALNSGIAIHPCLKHTLRDSVISSKYGKRVTDIDCGNGENRFRLTLLNGLLQLYGGKRCDTEIMSSDIGQFFPDSIGFILGPGASVEVSDISLSKGEAPHYNVSHDTFPDLGTLDEYLSHQHDLTEGYWHIFDYNLDDELLKTGGDYSMAIVRRGSGYDVLYLSGASVNADAWEPLMLKAELRDTPVRGVYDLVWYDAQGRAMTKGLKALRSDDDNISLHFPAQSSSLRLRRISFR